MTSQASLLLLPRILWLCGGGGQGVSPYGRLEFLLGACHIRSLDIPHAFLVGGRRTPHARC